jgi:hypothetical protein
MDAAGQVLAAERGGEPRRRLGRRRRVQRGDVAEHGRVRLGVREVERAAQQVADLVVQGAADEPEGPARQGGAVQEPLMVVGVEALAQRPRAALGEQRADRRRSLRPQRVDAVGERVHGARPRDLGRQAADEVGVVDHGAWPHRLVAARALAAL